MIYTTNPSRGSANSGASARGRGVSDDDAPHPDGAAIAKAIPKFGVALFENPKDMSRGWACRAGESPFFFESVSDLANDTIWVTSLSWEEYQLRAQKLSHLRRLDYLRAGLSAVAADLGRRMVGGMARETSAVLAAVVRRSILTAVNVYGWKSPTTELRADALVDDIRRTLPATPKTPSHMRTALASAYQSYSSPDWPLQFEPDSITLNLRYNRLHYADRLTSVLVPDDTWEYYSAERVYAMSKDELLDPARPCLIEGTVELGDIDPSIASLIAFGATASKRTALRKWISQPELVWLLRYAKVNVASALVARAARPLPDTARVPAKLLADPLFALSISAGLVAECHWYAVAAPTYNRMLKTNDYNSWAVWLRAYDRAWSFDLALKAYEAGFRVSGYGNGSLTIRLRRNQLPDCLAFAEANGIALPGFHALFEEHGIDAGAGGRDG